MGWLAGAFATPLHSIFLPSAHPCTHPPPPPRSKYVEPTLEHCRRNFKTVVPLPPINQVQTLCKVCSRAAQGG